MEENSKKWLEPRYGGWRVAFMLNPRNPDVMENDFSYLFIWALEEYNSEFLDIMQGLVASHFPDKSPIEVYNIASVTLSDSGYQDSRAQLSYTVHIRGKTPLGLGLYILEARRNDAFPRYVVPMKQTINNKTMAEVIEWHARMAENYLATQDSQGERKRMPDF